MKLRYDLVDAASGEVLIEAGQKATAGKLNKLKKTV